MSALQLGKALIFAGLALAALGLLVMAVHRLPLGRLPGDIAIVRPGFRFYFPLTTCLLLSALLGLAARLYLKLRS